jgi:hypothetical protein
MGSSAIASAIATAIATLILPQGFCADQQQRGRAAHPATRLMDLGRGLDPYTTSSPIAVVGEGALP